MRNFKADQAKRYLSLIFLILCSLVPLARFNAQGNLSESQLDEISVDRYGFEMVYVPSGTVEMGINRDDFDEILHQGTFGDVPPSQLDLLTTMAEEEGVFETATVTVPRFWIDRYEITIKQYQSRTEQCIGTGRCSTIDLSYAPQLISDANQPQVGVTWFDAVRFCMARDARLPTEVEWEYTASGPKSLVFPWGNTLVLDNISANNTTYPVGSRSGNVSWAGVYDLAGNAAEWVEDRIKPYVSSDSYIFPLQSQSDVNRVVRGGSYRTTMFLMSSFARATENPDSQGEIGFRCVRSTDPQKQ